MSLVNDMLKALEQRDGLDENETETLGCVVAVDSEDKSIAGSLIVKIIAFAIVCFSITVFLLVQLNARVNNLPLAQKPLTDVDSIAQEITIEPNQPDTLPMVETTAEPQLTTAFPAINLLPEAKTIVPAATVSEKINELLRDGQLALLNDRLTDPVEDNAFARFQAVLRIDPSHQTALDGLRGIAARYLDFARTTYQRGELQQTQRYLDTAEVIAGEYPSIQFWLQQQKSALAWVETLQEQIKSAPAVTNDKPQLAARAPTITVQPSLSYRDQQIADQAALLMAQQRWGEAEDLLTQAIGEQPQLHLSRKQLFSLYINRGQREQAANALDAMTKLKDAEKIHLQARLAIAFKDWSAALEVLQKPNLSLENRTLLAAVLQLTGEFEQSAEQYRQLVQLEQRNANYWLGLAVSLDALKDSSGALRAFRYARMHGGLDPNILAYVQERIDSLSHSVQQQAAG